MKKISLNDCAITDIGRNHMFEIEDLTPTDRIIRNERGNDEKVLFSNFLVGNWSFLLTATN